MTAAKWQSTADNTPQNWQRCCHWPNVKANQPCQTAWGCSVVWNNCKSSLPNCTIIGPMPAQLVPTSPNYLGIQIGQVFHALPWNFQATSWQPPSRMLHKHCFFWFAKSDFLEFAILPSKLSVLSNGTHVSVTSEPVMLPVGHGTTTMGQPLTWQSMQASGTIWHMFDVCLQWFWVGLCGVNLD